ncbi:MAG: patatin-like phospholipase family protein [Actinomycetota bacterium]
MADILTTWISPPETKERPKLGLTLSGGGFRTALFHIGVLMRLAELGVLKHVEVLATVSGGSIVGAAFYLRLLAKLEESGRPLDDGDMVSIVAGLAEHFPEMVRKNVRMRAFTSYRKNVEMCQADYSRSDRVAELFDRYFLKDILPGAESPVRMSFLDRPNLDDGPPARGCQPRLLINATSLNTGRAWRFSAVTMGEAILEGQQNDIDRVCRYDAPASYGDLDDHPHDVPLAIAVAASSAFPAGLQPMAISGMYEDRIQLSDGGVHDNQGVQALIDQGCTHFVVSDTGGQMSDQTPAKTSFLSVLLRANGILYGRVRQEQLFRASERRPPDISASPLALIHLHRGVSVEREGYLGPGGEGGGTTLDPLPEGPSEAFGIDHRVMDHLARIRTDLDSFSEVESKSLMAAGYLVAGSAIQDPGWSGSDLVSGVPVPWPDVLGLQDIRGYMAGPTKEYVRQLKIGKSRFNKALRVHRWLWSLTLIIAGAAAVAAFGAAVRFRTTGIPLGWLVLALVILGFAVVFPMWKYGAKFLDMWPATWFRWIRNVLLVGWVAALWSNAYLLLFEPMFQHGGSLLRLQQKAPPSPATAPPPDVGTLPPDSRPGRPASPGPSASVR